MNEYRTDYTTRSNSLISTALIPRLTGCEDGNARYGLINLSNIKHLFQRKVHRVERLYWNIRLFPKLYQHYLQQEGIISYCSWYFKALGIAWIACVLMLRNESSTWCLSCSLHLLTHINFILLSVFILLLTH